MVTGPGSETSDSVPAFLSRGERVVTAKKNKEYWSTLSAVHNGLVPSNELNDFVENYAGGRKNYDGGIIVLNSKDSQMSKELREIKDAILRQGNSTINIDDKGIHAIVDRINLKNNRLRKYIN